MSATRREAAEALRQRAEALLAASPTVDQRDEAANITALAHEIAVHQAELELQNDELQDAQAALQDARDRFAELFESAPVGYVVLDAAGIVRQANATWCAMLNLENDDVRGQPFADAIVPEDVPVFLSRFRTFFRNPTDKQIVVRMTRVGAAPFHAQIEAKPRTPQPSAAFGAGASRQELMVIVSDITDRMRADAERDQLREELAQARRIESVGRLAGGVAHDFNNMLGVILGHTDLAMDSVDPVQPVFKSLQEIRKAAGRSADLTRQLLAFARKQTIAPRVLELNATVEGMLTLLRRLIGEGIDLTWLPGKGLGSIMVDPTQIDQIMANLCANARDAVGGQGRVTIETGAAAFAAADCADRPGLRPGDYVWVAVRDDGCGMDAETRACLFEPFFTTKGIGRGTGLGLATVYGIVKQNAGYIDVHSEPGAGTTFTCYLPTHVRPADRDRVEPEPALAPRGQETILLVEDEEAILQMASTMLQRQGYAVLAADSPAKCLRLVESYAGRIDLLMTDVVMPGMNGRDLARTLLARYPGLKHLYMSGYTADVIAPHGVLDTGVHFIQKPFTMKDLAATIRTVLGHHTP